MHVADVTDVDIKFLYITVTFPRCCMAMSYSHIPTLLHGYELGALAGLVHVDSLRGSRK